MCNHFKCPLTLGGIPKSGTFCSACFFIWASSGNLLHCAGLESSINVQDAVNKYVEIGQSKQTKQKVPDFGIPPSAKIDNFFTQK